LADSCEHGNQPSDSFKGRVISLLAERTVSFSRRTLLHGVSYENPRPCAHVNPLCLFCREILFIYFLLTPCCEELVVIADRVPQSDGSGADPVPETSIHGVVRAYPQCRHLGRGVLPVAGRLLQCRAAPHRHLLASAACTHSSLVALVLHGPRDSGGQSPAELPAGM
jgi:hypothetical protein